MRGVLRTSEFTRQNPFQRVPVLILDDETALSETVAICRYFEEFHPEPAPLGKRAIVRATIEIWNPRRDLEVAQVKDWANKAKPLEVPAILDEQLERAQVVSSDSRHYGAGGARNCAARALGAAGKLD